MNIQSYIESGILEEYFLGLLPEAQLREVGALCLQYPELSAELALIEAQFNLFAEAHAAPAPIALQEEIWSTLENLKKEKTMDLQDLPLINKFTDARQWMGLVKPFIPTTMPDERLMHLLQHTPKVLQMMVISRTDFDDETHDELHESFIILEGECECTVGDTVFRVSAGGYASIPLHVPHSVKIISPYVLAIMQRVAV